MARTSRTSPGGAAAVDRVLLEDAPYARLPAACKRALRAFADVPSAKDPVLERFRHEYHYRYELVPAEEAKRFCMALWSPEMRQEFASFDDYHKWYLRANDVPDHGQSRWPCIRSAPAGRSADDEWLTDGWHRFHAYIRAGDATIPVLTIL